MDKPQQFFIIVFIIILLIIIFILVKFEEISKRVKDIQLADNDFPDSKTEFKAEKIEFKDIKASSLKIAHVFIHGTPKESAETLKFNYNKCVSENKFYGCLSVDNINEFKELVNDSDIVNIYYSGHGTIGRAVRGIHYPKIEIESNGRVLGSDILSEIDNKKINLIVECCAGRMKSIKLPINTDDFISAEKITDSSFRFLIFSQHALLKSYYKGGKTTPLHSSYENIPQNEKQLERIIWRYRRSKAGIPLVYTHDENFEWVHNMITEEPNTGEKAINEFLYKAKMVYLHANKREKIEFCLTITGGLMFSFFLLFLVSLMEMLNIWIRRELGLI